MEPRNKSNEVCLPMSSRRRLAYIKLILLYELGNITEDVVESATSVQFVIYNTPR